MPEQDDFWEFQEEDKPIANDTPGFDDLDDDATDSEPEQEREVLAGASRGDEQITMDGPEEKVEAAEEPTEPTPEVPATPEGNQELAKVFGDVIKVVGDKTMLKVAGKEYNVSDLSQEELVVALQKGMYADKMFQENAQRTRELAEKEQLLERGARVVQDLMARHGQGAKAGQNMPEFLRPNEYDDDNTKSLKDFSAQMYQEVQQLKGASANVNEQKQRDDLFREIDTHSPNFPVASVDEVLALKVLGADAAIPALMEASNRYYSSTNFIKKAMEANPTAKREIAEEIIKGYNLKRQQAGTVNQRSSRTSGTNKVSAGRSSKIKDFDDADSLAFQFLKNISASGE